MAAPNWLQDTTGLFIFPLVLKILCPTAAALLIVRRPLLAMEKSLIKPSG
jgi:hypothetical protein